MMASDHTPIYVTQPSLAPLEEYNRILAEVWESGILTHNGPKVQTFEKQFSDMFCVPELIAVTNGTIALQIALKALGLKGGEVITTAFTWVATVSAIKWERCKPVFVDIDPETLNMDPGLIEAAITKDTVAIMPVHVFGNPCDVKAIEAIAKKHNLKVIYDASHAVGSTFRGKSLLEYGDVSSTSFHATKLLNTAEGGGCIATNAELTEKLKRIRFFGHDTEKEIVEDGFNGKMTEVHAALGLANLKYIKEVISDRKRKYHYYKEGLKGVSGLSFQKMDIEDCNCSYFPLMFESEEQMLAVISALEAEKIHPRRYFYPAVNTLEHIVDYTEATVSEDVATRILCLPLYWSLEIISMDKIINIIKQVFVEVLDETEG